MFEADGRLDDFEVIYESDSEAFGLLSGDAGIVVRYLDGLELLEEGSSGWQERTLPVAEWLVGYDESCTNAELSRVLEFVDGQLVASMTCHTVGSPLRFDVATVDLVENRLEFVGSIARGSIGADRLSATNDATLDGAIVSPRGGCRILYEIEDFVPSPLPIRHSSLPWLETDGLPCSGEDAGGLSSAVVSADHESVAFVGSVGGASRRLMGVYLFDLATAETKRLTDDFEVRDIAWLTSRCVATLSGSGNRTVVRVENVDGDTVADFGVPGTDGPVGISVLDHQTMTIAIAYIVEGSRSQIATLRLISDADC